MISITTNIKEVSARLLRKMYAISSKPNLDAMSREIATTLLGEMRERIHEEGKDSASTQIGEYPESYMNIRVKKYNRTRSRRVVFSLTRQMENDMSSGAIKTPDGYGIGFKNQFNFQKSQWAQDHYHKPIYKPTANERQLAHTVAENFINQAIQKI